MTLTKDQIAKRDHHIGTGLCMLVLALCLWMWATGCAGPRVVFVPAKDAPVRVGPDAYARVYVWSGSAWELSANKALIPEGLYVWDSGEGDNNLAQKGK